jgi:hypothetical protein
MEVVKFCAAMSAQALSTEFLLGHAMVPRSAFASGKMIIGRARQPSSFAILDAERNVGVARDQSSRS